MMKITLALLLFISTLCIEPNDNCNIEHCDKCPESPYTCTECKDEFFLANNTCYDCQINCKKCTGNQDGQCLQCNNGYALDYEGFCARVNVDNCLKTDVTRKKCKECLNGFTLDDNGKCISKTCSVYKCLSCPEKEDTCKKCNDEFYVLNGTCTSCPMNCKECSYNGDFGCNICNEGYAMDYDGYCIKIGMKYCLKADYEKKKCRQCWDGFTLDQNGTCIEMNCKIGGCTSCPNKEDECLACNEEYFLFDKTCKDCAMNCRICSDEKTTSCKYCLNRYALDYDGLCEPIDIPYCWKLDITKTKCRECSEGYSLDKNGNCMKSVCKEGCVQCYDGTSGCNKCNDGYFLINNGCTKCAENCRQCQNEKDDGCQMCNYNYGFNSAHKCIEVGGGNCLKADENKKICVECIDGYHWDEKRRFCVEGKKSSSTYIKVGLLMILILLL